MNSTGADSNAMQRDGASGIDASHSLYHALAVPKKMLTGQARTPTLLGGGC